MPTLSRIPRILLCYPAVPLEHGNLHMYNHPQLSQVGITIVKLDLPHNNCLVISVLDCQHHV